MYKFKMTSNSIEIKYSGFINSYYGLGAQSLISLEVYEKYTYISKNSIELKRVCITSSTELNMDVTTNIDNEIFLRQLSTTYTPSGFDEIIKQTHGQWID